MKKILALLLALVMVLGLVACAGDTNTTTTDDSTTNQTDTTDTTACCGTESTMAAAGPTPARPPRSLALPSPPVLLPIPGTPIGGCLLNRDRCGSTYRSGGRARCWLSPRLAAQ